MLTDCFWEKAKCLTCRQRRKKKHRKSKRKKKRNQSFHGSLIGERSECSWGANSFQISPGRFNERRNVSFCANLRARQPGKSKHKKKGRR